MLVDSGQSAFLLSLKACSKVHIQLPTDVYLNDNGLESLSVTVENIIDAFAAWHPRKMNWLFYWEQLVNALHNSL